MVEYIITSDLILWISFYSFLACLLILTGPKWKSLWTKDCSTPFTKEVWLGDWPCWARVLKLDSDREGMCSSAQIYLLVPNQRLITVKHYMWSVRAALVMFLFGLTFLFLLNGCSSLLYNLATYSILNFIWESLLLLIAADIVRGPSGR